MIDSPIDDITSTTTIPTAEQMLLRLHEIDTEEFDLKKVEAQMRGNRVWINTLTVPISTLALVIFTFLGAWLSGHLIISFLVSAAIIFFIGKMFESYDHQVKWLARREVERRIAEIEGDFGVVVHFKPFLPTRYRHLIQSLRRGRFLYIDQYIQAVNLLQHQLNHEKFTKAWHIVYPEVAPPEPSHPLEVPEEKSAEPNKPTKDTPSPKAKPSPSPTKP